MSAIGGPGGIGGPKDPVRTHQGLRVLVTSRRSAISPMSRARATRAVELEAMAADIAAGKLTAHEAIDRLVDEICGTDQLASAERAELRELLTDLVANDPYLQSLVGRVAASRRSRLVRRVAGRSCPRLLPIARRWSRLGVIQSVGSKFSP